MKLSNDQLAAVSLVVFTFQNAAFVLLMRQSKVMNTGYNSTVAVFIMELLKLPLAFALLVHESGGVVNAAGGRSTLEGRPPGARASLEAAL